MTASHRLTPPVAISSSTPRRRARAFTLIELLTVIAIIGILAAILIPVVGQVRKTAKYSTNVSNVRQWTIACTLHMADHKGYPPYQGKGSMTASDASDVVPFTVGGVLPWYNALPPYIGQKTLAEIVSLGGTPPKAGDNSVWVSPFAEDTSGTLAWAGWLSYAPSQISNTMSAMPQNRYLVNMRQVKDPSRTVLFGETANLSRAKQGGVAYKWVNANSTPGAVGRYNRNGTDGEAGGLQGKAALGFFDGSVRTYSGAQIDAHNANDTVKRGDNKEGIVWLCDKLAGK